MGGLREGDGDSALAVALRYTAGRGRLKVGELYRRTGFIHVGVRSKPAGLPLPLLYLFDVLSALIFLVDYSPSVPVRSIKIISIIEKYNYYDI